MRESGERGEADRFAGYKRRRRPLIFGPKENEKEKRKYNKKNKENTSEPGSGGGFTFFTEKIQCSLRFCSLG